jgi:hypothetical protein
MLASMSVTGTVTISLHSIYVEFIWCHIQGGTPRPLTLRIPNYLT